MENFSIDGIQYSTDGLSEEGKNLFKQLKFTQLKLQELSNTQGLLNKARNAYIADLKIEIVEGRSGVNLGKLFTDE